MPCTRTCSPTKYDVQPSSIEEPRQNNISLMGHVVTHACLVYDLVPLRLGPLGGNMSKMKTFCRRDSSMHFLNFYFAWSTPSPTEPPTLAYA